MEGYLTWKVFGPDIRNPYKSELPIATLRRMVENHDALAQGVNVRCLCDGFEVMSVTNPLKPRVTSNHPCISAMRKDEILAFMEESGIFEMIETEMEKIRVDLLTYLAEREKRAPETNAQAAEKKKSKAPAKEVEQKKPSSQNMRIVRR
jgi:hypothetical protein